MGSFGEMYNKEIEKEKIKTDKEMSEKEKDEIRSKYKNKPTTFNQVSQRLERLDSEIFVLNSKINHVLESQRRVESKLNKLDQIENDIRSLGDSIRRMST